MARFPGVRLAAATALLAGLASPSAAQGGWAQWDVLLRDGTRVVANPLGAPDDGRVSLSVDAFECGEFAIPRSRIDYIAARATVGPADESSSGTTLLPAPRRAVRDDVIVRRDGRRTTGRVTLTRIRFSTGVVTQRGVEIDLADVAYIKFASGRRKRSKHLPRASHAPEVECSRGPQDP
jgi:hypothetical protein